MGHDDIPIDLLVYCGANTFDDSAANRPANAARILNFLATGFIWNGAHLTGALNECYSDAWHFGSVTHLHTLNVLVDELTVVAARVPVNSPLADGGADPHGPRSPPDPDEAPDEWDFMQLRPPPGQPHLPSGQPEPSRRPIPPTEPPTSGSHPAP